MFEDKLVKIDTNLLAYDLQVASTVCAKLLKGKDSEHHVLKPAVPEKLYILPDNEPTYVKIALDQLAPPGSVRVRYQNRHLLTPQLI